MNPKEDRSIVNQIRANSVARANGFDGAVYVDGQYRPCHDPDPDGVDGMSDDELDDYLRDRYPDWSF